MLDRDSANRDRKTDEEHLSSDGKKTKKFPSMLRSIAILATGTAAGQAISLLIMPVITRLYTPADYGVFGVFTALVTILGSVVGLKFEAAILLPPRTRAGTNTVYGLFRLSILSSLLVALALFVVAVILNVFFGGGPFAALGGWLLLVPFTALISGISLTFMAVATREAAYGQLSRIPASQKLSSGGLQILGGFAGAGVLGLIAGAVTQSLVTIGILGRGRIQFIKESFRKGRQERELPRLVSEYRDFPLISAPISLVETLAWNSQVVVLAWFYAPNDLGLFSFALAAVGLPLNVILSGVSRVYLRESAARKDNPAQARQLFFRLLIGLLLASIPVFIILYLASQHLFGPIFGDNWVGAGLIAQGLLPLLWARFMSTTVATTFTVYRTQSWYLWWQLIALAVTTSGFIIGGTMEFAVEDTVALASWMTVPLYLLLVPLAYYILRRGGREPAAVATEPM